MPNIKRRFADDDPPTEDEDDGDDEAQYHGGGKTMRMLGHKRLKQLQEGDSSSGEEEAPSSSTGYNQGKQIRPSFGKQLPQARGKQLRSRQVESDDDDDDDEELDDDEPVSAVQRGGGAKSLMRMRAPAEDEDNEDEDESMMRTQAPSEDEDEEDEDSSEDEEEPTQIIRAAGAGGKSLARGGKSLARGKILRRMPELPENEEEEESEDDDDEEEEARPASKRVIIKAPAPMPARGKQLRRTVKEDTSDDDMDMQSEDEEVEAVKIPEHRREASAKKPDSGMDESDDDDEESSDEEAEWDTEKFNPDSLVEDEEDRKYLDSLTEFEREAVLGERFEKRKAAYDMKKALRESKRKEREEKAAKEAKKDTKKRRATAASKKATKKSKKMKDDEDETGGDEALAKSLASKRESIRNRDATGKKAAKQSALAALREERQRATRRVESEESEDSFADDSDDDSDDDYEDTATTLKPWQRKAAESKKSRLDKALEDEEEDRDDKLTQERVVVEADLEDYQKVTLPRRRLGRWCNEPFFEEAVMNCFVKLFIGENEQGKRCYRLCRIVGVETSDFTYQLPAVKQEKPVKTDKLLRLKFGENERGFPIKLVSDAKATESDIQQYINITKAGRQNVLTKKQASRMRRVKDDLVNNYTYTTQDIENNIRKKKEKGQTAANLGLEQTRAAIAVEAARAAVTDAKNQVETAQEEADVSKAKTAYADAERLLEKRLEEEKQVLEKVKNRKNRLTSRSGDQKWAKVNQRNIQKNQKSDLGALKPKEKKDDSAGAQQKFNPFARRKVKPKILWEVGQKDEESKENEGEAPKDNSKSKENAEKEQDITPSLVQEHQEKAAALSQSHQFAIDEEVLAQSSFTSGIVGLTAKKAAKKRVRKGLSLAEYHERKAGGTL